MAVHLEPALGEAARRLQTDVASEPAANATSAVTNVPMNLVFERLTSRNFTAEDLGHLERLSVPRVRGLLGTATSEVPYASRDNGLSDLTLAAP